MIELLTEDERNETLRQLREAGWEEVSDRDALHKVFCFRNFSAAFGWMTQVAMAAEKMNHHPEWSNVYNKVEVVLTTHSAKGLTNIDVLLARKMDALTRGS